MSESTDLRTVRQQLGLTQQELAYWLGVKRERVAQAEIGQRALPFGAWPYLTRLTLGLAAAGRATEPPHTDFARQARLRECRYQAARLREQHRLMQQRAAPLLRRLAVLGPVLAVLPDTPEAAARRRWLTRHLDEATDVLAAEVGAGPQALLAARLAACEHEMELLEQLNVAGG